MAISAALYICTVALAVCATPLASWSYCSPPHPAQRGNSAVMRRPRGYCSTKQDLELMECELSSVFEEYASSLQDVFTEVYQIMSRGQMCFSTGRETTPPPSRIRRSHRLFPGPADIPNILSRVRCRKTIAIAVKAHVVEYNRIPNGNTESGPTGSAGHVSFCCIFQAPKRRSILGGETKMYDDST